MSGIPEIESEYSPSYKRINVAGILGGIVPGGVDALLYSEERRADRALETQPPSGNRITIKRTIECGLLIDPMQMKSIHQWLGVKIQEYESVFGHIPSPEEAESRARRRSGQ